MFGAITPPPSAEERTAIEQALRPLVPAPARSAWWRRGILESTGAAEPDGEPLDGAGAKTPS